MTQKICYSRLTPLALAAVLGLAGCDFKVDNPGRVLEEDLNTVDAVDALVTGMSSDFSEEYDGVAFIIARASDEMAGSGSYNQTNNFRRGLIPPDDIDGEWEGTPSCLAPRFRPRHTLGGNPPGTRWLSTTNIGAEPHG